MLIIVYYYCIFYYYLLWNFSQRWTMNGWGAMETSSNILQNLFRYQGRFLHTGGQMLAWVAQRGCGASILGDIQNLTEHSPEQLALTELDSKADPALSRALTTGPSVVLPSQNYSVILFPSLLISFSWLNIWDFSRISLRVSFSLSEILTPDEIIWVCNWDHEGRCLCFIAASCPSLGSRTDTAVMASKAVPGALVTSSSCQGSGEAEPQTPVHAPGIYHTRTEDKNHQVWAALPWQATELKQLLSRHLKDGLLREKMSPLDKCWCPDLAWAEGDLRQKVSWEHSHTPSTPGNLGSTSGL